MLLQRLAAGATGVKQARYRRGPTRGSETLIRACAVYTQPVYSHCVYGRSLALAVQCEEFRRGFCTLVLSFFREGFRGFPPDMMSPFAMRGPWMAPDVPGAMHHIPPRPV